MVKEYVFDANAIMRYFGVVKAEGEPKVRELFKLSDQGESRLLMSVINLGEVYYILLKLAGDRATREYVKTLQHSVTMIGADQSSTIEAATLKHGYKIGYADSFAAALALNRKATLVSADPSFEKFGKALKWLRLPLVCSGIAQEIPTQLALLRAVITSSRSESQTVASGGSGSL